MKRLLRAELAEGDVFGNDPLMKEYLELCRVEFSSLLALKLCKRVCTVAERVVVHKTLPLLYLLIRAMLPTILSVLRVRVGVCGALIGPSHTSLWAAPLMADFADPPLRAVGYLL